MENIKFSIITVTLDSENYIENTILSVARQTYKNKEHLIIDGGSTDSTIDIIRRYYKHLSYLVSEPDNGIADAMNKGISRASGDYILFINSDDYLLNENILNRIYLLIQERLDYYIFKVLSIYSGNTQKILPSKDFGLSTYFKMGSCHQGHVISRKLFQKYGVYDSSFKIGMDYDFVLRIFQQGIKSKSMDLVISGMRRTGVSSRKDWSGLKERYDEERLVHYKNCESKSMFMIYKIYWTLYIPYRFFRYLIYLNKKYVKNKTIKVLQ